MPTTLSTLSNARHARVTNAAVRVFGSSGGVSPRGSWNAASFGRDLNGAAVSSGASYVEAVRQLRTPSGHNPLNSSSWANPANFSNYDYELSTPDPTKPSGQSILAQFQQLQAMGIEPLAVQWTTARRGRPARGGSQLLAQSLNCRSHHPDGPLS